MLKQLKTTRKQRGLSLVELMVTMLLGLIIMAGVIQIFISNKATYKVQEGLVQVQENMRFAFETMAHDIRMAGYLGCSRSVDTTMAIANPHNHFNPRFGIQGWEANATGPTTAAIPLDAYAVSTAPTNGVGDTTVGTAVVASWHTLNTDSVVDGNNDRDTFRDANVVPGTDILRVWFADDRSIGIQSIQENSDSTKPQSVTLENAISGNQIQVGDILIFNDCSFADIAIACNISSDKQTIDLADCGGGLMQNDGSYRLASSEIEGEVTKLKSSLYFIAKQADDPNNPPSLYRRVMARNGDADGTNGQSYIAPEVELIRGVENMQILYGIDSNGDGDANNYVTADDPALSSWNEVVSVKISLLMSTPDTVPTSGEGNIYNVNGTYFDPADDDRLRKVYSTTIQLRNRTI
jgi:type IV pilus assembly protein PilW